MLTPATDFREATVRELSLRSFRTYATLDLELDKGVNVFVGQNGVGKTNLLESLAWLSYGSSPRTTRDAEAIAANDPFFRVAGTTEVAGIRHSRAVTYQRVGGKRLQTDGEPTRSSEEFARQLPAVIFLPERLLVMRGAPARRRGTLDRLVSLIEPQHRLASRSYVTAMTQRNALLRAGKFRNIDDELSAWDHELIEHGSVIRQLRDRVVDQMTSLFRARFAELTGFTEGATRLELRGMDLAQSLRESEALDRRRGTTSVGPHLDDLVFSEGDRPLRSRGSTGEQRAALLAWALAERDLIHDRLGITPLLLLDEPYAELDPQRRSRLTTALGHTGQVVVTVTEPNLIGPELEGCTVFEVQSGEVHPWTSTTHAPYAT